MKKWLCLLLALICWTPAALAQTDSGLFNDFIVYEIQPDKTVSIIQLWEHNQKKLTLPKKIRNRPVTVLGQEDVPLWELEKVTQLTLPETCVTVTAYTLSDPLPKLTQLDLPASLEAWGSEDHFLPLNAPKLKAITVPEENQHFKAADGVLFSKDGKILYVYPAARKGAEYAIPDGVVKIMPGAFDQAANLKALSLPDSLESVEYLGRMPKLTQITVSENHPTLKTVEGVLFSRDGRRLIAYPGGRKEKSYTVPAGTRQIAPFAFMGSPNLTRIALGDEGVSSFPSRAFEGCTKLQELELSNSMSAPVFDDLPSLTAVTVREDHPTLQSVEGVLFSKEGGVLYYYPPARKGSKYTVPEGVFDIRPYAFKGSKNLTQVILPDSVTSLGEGAFSECQKLAKVTLSQELRELPRSAFKNCAKLQKVTLPEKIVTVGGHAFAGCKRLSSVTLPAALKTLSYSAFQNCSALKKIKLPDGLQTIGEACFQGANLQEVTLPASVRVLGDAAFEYNRKLRKVTIPEGLEEIGGYCFSETPSLKKLALPRSIKRIGELPFYFKTQVAVYEGSLAQGFLEMRDIPYVLR